MPTKVDVTPNNKEVRLWFSEHIQVRITKEETLLLLDGLLRVLPKLDA